METANWEALSQAINKFSKLNLTVIGDIMVDEFIWGQAARISPEAPVPVIEVARESKLLGVAANVARNLLSAGGGRVNLIGLVGDDPAGLELRKLMADLKLECDGLVVEPQRPTTLKTRVVAQSQQVIRYDREAKHQPRPEVLEQLVAAVKKLASASDVVIVSDYHKGVIGPRIMEVLIELGRQGLKVLVDPKVPNINLYKGVTAITPNHHEAGAITGLDTNNTETILQAGQKLLNELDLKALLITRGEAGMSLFQPGCEPTHIPTVAKQVFDVTGAGDTAIALWSLGLASGLNYVQAAYLANLGAGIVVGQTGTSAIQKQELLNAIKNKAGNCCESD